MPARNRQSGIPAPVGVKDPAAQKTLWALYERLNQDDATARTSSGGRRSSAGSDSAGGAAAGTGGNSPRPVRPNPPENLEASGIFGAILLEVDALPPSAAAIEWLAAPEDDLSQAVVVGQSPVPLFRHYVGDNATRWYWAKAVGFGQSPLRSGVNQTAGTRGQSAQNVDLILDNLNKQIGRDQLVDDVTSAIDLVTAGDDVEGSVAFRVAQLAAKTAEDLADEARTRSTEIDERAAALADDIAASASELSTAVSSVRDDLDAAVATRQSQINTLTTNLAQEVQNRIAQGDTQDARVDTEIEERISEDERVARVLTVLFANGGSTDPVYSRASDVPDDPPPGAYRIDDAAGAPLLRRYIDGQWVPVDGFDADSINAAIAEERNTRVAEREATAESLDLIRSQLVDAEENIAANTEAVGGLTTRVAENEKGIQAQASDFTRLESELTDLGQEQQATAGALDDLTTTVDQQGDTLSAQSQNLVSLTASVNQLRETGAENLLGADADDVAPDKTVTIDMAGAGLEPGDVVSAYGEFQRPDGARIDFVLSALDPGGSITGSATTANVGGVDWGAAKVQAFTIPAGSTRLRLEARPAGGAGGSGRSFSVNPGPLAVVFSAPSATAEAVGDLSARVEQTEDGVSSLTKDVSSLSGRVVDTETGQVAQGETIDLLDTRVEQTANALSTQSRSVERLQSTLLNDQAINLVLPPGKSPSAATKQLANAQAITGVTTRVEQTERGVSANAEDLSQLKTRADNADQDRQAASEALSGLTSSVDSLDGELESQANDLTQLSARVQAFKLEADYGFETGEAGVVGAPAGWTLDGDPIAQTYYSATVDPDSPYGSALSYGHDGTGPGPGAWAITKSFSIAEGGGDFSVDVATRVISGSAYVLLTCRDAGGDVIEQAASDAMSTGSDGVLSLLHTLPSGARLVDLSLRASNRITG